MSRGTRNVSMAAALEGLVELVGRQGEQIEALVKRQEEMSATENGKPAFTWLPYQVRHPILPDVQDAIKQFAEAEDGAVIKTHWGDLKVATRPRKFRDGTLSTEKKADINQDMRLFGRGRSVWLQMRVARNINDDFISTTRFAVTGSGNVIAFYQTENDDQLEEARRFAQAKAAEAKGQEAPAK